jgi:hypothetical protein
MITSIENGWFGYILFQRANGGGRRYLSITREVILLGEAFHVLILVIQCKGWFTQKVRPWNGLTLALQIHTSQFHTHFNTRLSRRMWMSYFDWQIVLTCFPWYRDSIGLVILFFECRNWNPGLRILLHICSFWWFLHWRPSSFNFARIL